MDLARVCLTGRKFLPGVLAGLVLVSAWSTALAQGPGSAVDEGSTGAGTGEAEEAGAAGAGEAKEADAAAAGEAEQAASAAAAAALKGGIKLEFEDMTLAMLLQDYSEVANATVVVARGVSRNIPATVINPVRLTKEEALQVLEAVLEVNDLTMVEVNGLLKVMKKTESMQAPIPTRMGSAPIKPGLHDKMVTQIMPLKHIQAESLVKDLKPLVSKTGMIFHNERLNALILLDNISNITRLSHIVNQLDVEMKEGVLRIEVVPLMYADETRLAETLQSIFAQTDTRAGTGTSRLPVRAIRRGEPEPVEAAGPKTLEDLLGRVKIIPDDRIKALIVITTAEHFSLVRNLIARLDRDAPKLGAKMRVFYLQHAKAEDVAKVMEDLFKGKEEEGRAPVRRAVPETTEETNMSGLVGDMNLVFDERTNALIITTAPENFEIIEELISKLDIRTPQVLIEALICEVKLTETNRLGVEYKWFDNPQFGDYLTERTGRADFGLQDWAIPTAGNEGVARDIQGLKYWMIRSDKDVGAFITALSTFTDVNVVSRPSIVVSNNQEAKIVVGDTIPILKDTLVTTTGGLARSYEYKDVATELSVKPRISENRDVVLEIKQSINEVGEFNPTLEAYSFTKREAETTMVTADGQTVILGGLIKERAEHSERKIPLLGDIPILGWLFRARASNASASPTKLELMVFITPKVIVTPKEADLVTADQEKRSTQALTPTRLETRESFKAARKHHRDREWAPAIEKYRRVLEFDPKHKEAEKFLPSVIEAEVGRLYGVADRYHGGGRYAEAIQAWEKILYYDSSQAKARSLIGKTITRLQKLQARRG